MTGYPAHTAHDRKSLVARVVEEVQPFTMIPQEALADTVRQALNVIDRDIRGALVECGTWMGGASFAMLLGQRYAYGYIRRPVWMFDSFEGLPPVEARDGPLAAHYQQDKEGPWYYENCRAPLDRVREAAARFNFSETEAVIVPGWFDQTIPKHRASLVEAGIALLRVDCDWYAPVSLVLEQLGSVVEEEGRILIDDYFAWDGCARAVHDYLSRHDLAWRLRTIGGESPVGVSLIKRSFRASYDQL